MFNCDQPADTLHQGCGALQLNYGVAFSTPVSADLHLPFTTYCFGDQASSHVYMHMASNMSCFLCHLAIPQAKLSSKAPFSQYSSVRGLKVHWGSPTDYNTYPEGPFDVVYDNNGKDMDSCKMLIDAAKVLLLQHVGCCASMPAADCPHVSELSRVQKCMVCVS